MTKAKIKEGLSVWYSYTKPSKLNVPTLVFIHGWVQNHTTWTRVISHLKKQGYGFLLIDLPGHGLSSTPRKISFFKINELANICAKVIIKCRLKKFAIIGHSMGGMIAQHLATRVKPSAVVLADTTYISPLADAGSRSGLHLPAIVALLKVIAKNAPSKKRQHLLDFSKKKSREDIILWLEGASETNARSLLACLHSILQFDSRKLLRKICCPVLLIVGSNDVRTPPTRMKRMMKYISDVRIVEIANSGHSTQLTAPKQFANNVHLFLKKKRNRKFLF